MVRSLRDGRAVWYAPDQSYNRKGSEVVPFFGIPSMHTTATSTLALDARSKAKMQGYEGDPCGECGNYTLVRNGTCMKCNTCGGTSGCS